MKITITPIGGTPFIIADDNIAVLSGSSFPNGAGGLVEGGFLPDITVATQREELIGSNYAMELPRGNQQTTYNFTVLRSLDTIDNTLTFLADHPNLVPLTGTLAVYIGGTTRYLRNAVLKSIHATEHSGLSFKFNYAFAGSYAPPITGNAGSGTGGAFTPN